MKLGRAVAVCLSALLLLGACGKTAAAGAGGTRGSATTATQAVPLPGGTEATLPGSTGTAPGESPSQNEAGQAETLDLPSLLPQIESALAARSPGLLEGSVPAIVSTEGNLFSAGLNADRSLSWVELTVWGEMGNVFYECYYLQDCAYFRYTLESYNAPVYMTEDAAAELDTDPWSPDKSTFQTGAAIVLEGSRFFSPETGHPLEAGAAAELAVKYSNMVRCEEEIEKNRFGGSPLSTLAATYLRTLPHVLRVEVYAEETGRDAEPDHTVKIVCEPFGWHALSVRDKGALLQEWLAACQDIITYHQASGISGVFEDGAFLFLPTSGNGIALLSVDDAGDPCMQACYDIQRDAYYAIIGGKVVWLDI